MPREAKIFSKRHRRRRIAQNVYNHGHEITEPRQNNENYETDRQTLENENTMTSDCEQENDYREVKHGSATFAVDSRNCFTRSSVPQTTIGLSSENSSLLDASHDDIRDNVEPTILRIEIDSSEEFVLHSTSDSESECSSYREENNTSDEEVITFSVRKAQFMRDLKKITIDHNVDHTVVGHYLKLIKPAYPFLPSDARTLLRTPRSGSMKPQITLINGKMYYFGIETALRRELNNSTTERNGIIELDINIDGLPIFKSSRSELWPILGCCRILNDKPFMIAVFCGEGKPRPLADYLKDFIAEIKYLMEFGTTYNDKTFKVRLRCFVCDAPARAMIKMIMGHTSRHGCENCEIEAKTENGKLFYPTGRLYRKRVDSDFFGCGSTNKTKRFHIKDRTPLLDIPNVQLVTRFPKDPLHLWYLGVCKRVALKYWVEGGRAFKLSRQQLLATDDKIREIRPYIPVDFARKPRGFVEIKRWKATEFRLFLLYTSIIVMYNILDHDKYQHFLLLHCAAMILSSEKLIDSHLHVAEEAIEKFVDESTHVYDRYFVVYNVHSLLHVCQDAKLYGTLENYSSFPFENFLNYIKQRIRAKRLPLEQTINRFAEWNSRDNEYATTECPAKEVEYHIKRITYPDSNDKTYFECESLKCSRFMISSKTPDNVVALGRNIYVIKSIFFVNGQYKCIGKPFRYLYDLYTRPVDSSQLGIYFARSYGHSTTFLFTDITYKCLRMPFKDGFIADKMVKTYAVAEFLNARNDNRECAVIPALWLTNNGTKCYWPQTKNEDAFQKLVIAFAPHQKSWRTVPIHRILHTCDNLKDADKYLLQVIENGTSEEGVADTLSVVMKSLVQSSSSAEDSPPTPAKKCKSHKRNRQHKHTRRAKKAKRSEYNASEASTCSASENETDKENNSTSRSKLNTPSGSSYNSKRRKDRTPTTSEQLSNQSLSDLVGVTPTYLGSRDSQLTDPVTPTTSFRNSSTDTGHNTSHRSRTPITSRTCSENYERSLTGLAKQAPVPTNITQYSRTHRPDASSTSRTSTNRFEALGNPLNTINTPRTNFIPLSDAAFQEKSFTYFERFQAMQEEGNIILSQILRTVESNIRSSSKPDDIPDFPLSTMQAFETLDTLLENETHSTYLKSRLASIGGTSQRQSVMGMLRFLLSNELAMKFNWAGHHGKRTFKITAVMGVIFEAAKVMFKGKHSSDKIIISAVQDWLKLAKNRHSYVVAKTA